MKIIHTADIHLDSPLVGVADGKVRRAELLRALFNISEYANNNGVQAVIVAGDLFDDKFVSQKTVESVAQIMNESCAKWFVLKGNHGEAKPYEMLQKLCEQVYFFGENWTTYTLDNVAICGRELGSNDLQQWSKLELNDNMYNILVLHGDIDDDKYGFIDKKAIAKLPISYVALGHRHTFAQYTFGKVRACYCGVPEARGFDESGDTGFVVVDTDSDKIVFRQQHIRRVETRQLDVSDIQTDFQLERRIMDNISDVSPRNYLNLEFFGQLSEGVRPVQVASELLSDKFFALRIKDKTVAKIDLEKLANEVSLRGEFVKLAMQIPDEKERDSVLRLGLAALRGEV